MTNLRKAIMTMVLLCMNQAYADCNFNTFACENAWSVTFNIGYSWYQNADERQGNTAAGRLAITRQLFTLGDSSLSFEGGLQTGNAMRFDIPKESLEILGGVPVSGSIKPMLDGLFTLSIPVSPSNTMYALVKGGASYRQLQLDRETIEDLSELNPQLQAGLGFVINDSIQANLTWQKIFGKNPEFKVDPLTETGKIAHIPSQDTVFFGLAIFF